jgi:hypothetical protein
VMAASSPANPPTPLSGQTPLLPPPPRQLTKAFGETAQPANRNSSSDSPLIYPLTGVIIVSLSLVSSGGEGRLTLEIPCVGLARFTA